MHLQRGGRWDFIPLRNGCFFSSASRQSYASEPVGSGKLPPVLLLLSSHSCFWRGGRNDTLSACPEPEACEHVLSVGYRAEESFPCKLLQPLDTLLAAVALAVGLEGRNALATVLPGPSGFTHSLCSGECVRWGGGNGIKFFAKGDLHNSLLPFE